jgi:hypothetical protein
MDYTLLFAISYLACREKLYLLILAGVGDKDDCKVCFTSLNILTLPSFYIFVCLIYVKLHLDEYTSHHKIHTYETRNKSNLCLKELRLNKSRTVVLFYGIKFYNKLPEVIRNDSIDNFKKTYKESIPTTRSKC